MKPLKILISAYACEPGKGSEPGVGWNFAVEMAKYHQVWVITRSNNRPVIETELKRYPVPNLYFAYHDLPPWASWWKRGGRGVQIYYYLWQLTGYGLAKRLHKSVNFDLAHHVTFVKYWAPSFLAFLNTPYILGPVGGGESAPYSIWSTLGFSGFVYELLRVVARKLGEMDPIIQHTIRNAKISLATTQDTQQRLVRLNAKETRVMSQVGLSQDEIDWLASFPAPGNDVIRFVSIGNLLALKGFHLGIEAFLQANMKKAEYWVIGDGPERKRLENFTERNGITGQVRFLGRLPREKTLSVLASGHVLVHPSLHDSGGWVILEAMALGKPVICLDLGGPATQITDETGIKVPAITAGQAVRDTVQGMIRLAEDGNLRTRLGRGGQQRVHEKYSWERKVQDLNCIYEQALMESLKNHDH